MVRALLLLLVVMAAGAPVAEPVLQLPVVEPPDVEMPSRSEDAISTEPAAPEPVWEWLDERWYQRVDALLYDESGIAWRPIVVTTTAYAPTLDQCDADPDVTATGSDAYATYGVAADPRALPYGSVVRIPGYGDAVVDDTGRAMRRSWRRGIVHLDLRIPKRRYDGVWRSDAECSRIARKHGVQRDRVVLIQVPITQPF